MNKIKVAPYQPDDVDIKEIGPNRAENMLGRLKQAMQLHLLTH